MAKNVLYRKMKPETFALISEELAPWAESLQGYSLGQYRDVLQALFKPPNESKALKMTYLERKQSSDEHYETYVHAKFRLWKRAHIETARDYDDLFTQITNGLYNKRARLYMRRYRKTNPPNVGDYLNELGYKQNELREKYMAGELAYAEIKGMESRDAYREMRKANITHTKVKSEICQITDGINALNGQKRNNSDLECWGCGQKGHMKAECPRTTSGLRTHGVSAVSAADAQSVAESESDNDDAQPAEINQLFNRKKTFFVKKDKSGPTHKGRFPRNKSTFKKRTQPPHRVVAQIVEDEEGNINIIHVNEDAKEEAGGQPREDEPEDDSDVAVHFLA